MPGSRRRWRWEVLANERGNQADHDGRPAPHGGREGLVFEGCAGPEDWVKGINETLTESGILLNGTTLRNVSTFELDGRTCLLFDFEGAELSKGKLAMWRINTHAQFGGTWLSDYVPNRLGGFIQEQKESEKPDCELIGQDGNIFNLMGIASRTLRQNGMEEQAQKMRERIMGGDCPDYNAALRIIGEYVNITGPKEPEESMVSTPI